MKDEKVLLDLREKANLSPEELADLCSSSVEDIRIWESGEVIPKGQALAQLAKHLHVNEEMLLLRLQEAKSIQKTKTYFHKSGWSREYTSSCYVLGIPLLHINIGRGRRYDGSRHFARGIIAIGNSAIGVIAVGYLTAGIFSMGLLSLGIVTAVGLLAISYFAIGALAIGYLCIGVMAIGVYSIGLLAIGYQLCYGPMAYGVIAIGQKAYGTQSIMLHESGCLLLWSNQMGLRQIIQSRNLPSLMEWILSSIPMCGG